MVSVVWNAYLMTTGRRVTLRHVRQALIPGVFLGLNLTAFFTGATLDNSVANAALIGSLSPFLIVPIGAWLFRQSFNLRALVFALIAFGGMVIVLLNAPPAGDASVRGNVLGMTAMVLWTGYVVSIRAFRRDTDVATFMAALCPIATVAVLPLAIANGGMFGMSVTGWTYTLILTFMTGVAAHGLMVFAQRTIQIGTIGISQVIQPALAVLWSFLLLGERLRPLQALGIAIVMAGLFAFLVLNQRGGRTRRVREPGTQPRCRFRWPPWAPKCCRTLVRRWRGSRSRRRSSGGLPYLPGVDVAGVRDESGRSPPCADQHFRPGSVCWSGRLLRRRCGRGASKPKTSTGVSWSWRLALTLAAARLTSSSWMAGVGEAASSGAGRTTFAPPPQPSRQVAHSRHVPARQVATGSPEAASAINAPRVPATIALTMLMNMDVLPITWLSVLRRIPIV